MNSVIAIVTFSIPSEAKRAFNHLSYRKYQHIPLYLEYLPIDLWSEGMIDGMVWWIEYEKEKQSVESEKKESEEKQSTTSQKRDAPDEEDDGDSTTLYIKNLNWKTTEQSIRKMFGKVDGLKTVVLPQKKGPNGENLPLGFGFVVYENRQQALKALNK